MYPVWVGRHYSPWQIEETLPRHESGTEVLLPGSEVRQHSQGSDW
jgi:hypothetical protein